FWYVADADLVWTGTRYALGVGYAPAGYYATLIDDQTGNVTTISKPGCAPGVPSDLEPLSLPWVVLDCAPLTIAPFGSAPPAPELYSPATGEWQTVSPSPGLS